MNLAERLRRLVEGVPDEGAVTLPVATLQAWLEGAGDGEPGSAGERGAADVADLTVPELADALDLAESTVRGWMPQVDGSYKMAGQWWISRSAWRAHLDALADGDSDGPPEVRSNRNAELDDWREERGVA